MKEIILPLAQGFEDIEAVSVFDILKRADLNVITVGLDNKQIKSSKGLNVLCNKELKEIDINNISAVVLPGGPGTKNLMQSTLLRQILIEADKQEILICAICAAPTVLYAAGILNNKNITCYPSFEKQMENINFKEDRVVKDENIITSRGPGTAIEFALEIVKELVSKEKSDQIKKAVLL